MDKRKRPENCGDPRPLLVLRRTCVRSSIPTRLGRITGTGRISELQLQAVIHHNPSLCRGGQNTGEISRPSRRNAVSVIYTPNPRIMQRAASPHSSICVRCDGAQWKKHQHDPLKPPNVMPHRSSRLASKQQPRLPNGGQNLTQQKTEAMKYQGRDSSRSDTTRHSNTSVKFEPQTLVRSSHIWPYPSRRS